MKSKRLVFFGLLFFLTGFFLTGYSDIFSLYKEERAGAEAGAITFFWPQTAGQSGSSAAPEGEGRREENDPAALLTELDKDEIAAGEYYQLIDETGKVITATGHRLRAGDQYLDEKNRLYVVEKVQGYQAQARYLRTERLKKPVPKNRQTGLRSAVGEPFPTGIGAAGQPAHDMPAGKKESDWPHRIIAIYHTHNDECYVPSDGVESVYGRGGIHAVGWAFKEALEKKNIHVVYSEDLHLPHDRDAYLRARGTAVELLEHDPDAIFDIHRDAAPPETYAARVADSWVTKIQFVVGQENPAFAINRSFAYDLKALADEIYPGLIKGVLLSWGDFNQDLTPLNLLLEVGTHLNSKEAAQSGISLFADVVSFYFYGDSGGEETGKGFTARGGAARGSLLFRTILLIAGVAAAGLLGFYFLNNPVAWERFRGQLKLYLGSGGLVWQEGRKNLIQLGREIARAARQAIIYLYIFGGLLRTFLRRLRNRLKL